VENRKKTKSKKTPIFSEVSVNSPQGIRRVSPGEEKEGCGGKDRQKRRILADDFETVLKRHDPYTIGPITRVTRLLHQFQ